MSSFLSRLAKKIGSRKGKMLLAIGAIFLLVAAGGLYYYFNSYVQSGRWAFFAEIRTDPETFAKYAIQSGTHCGNALFAFPTSGVVLGLWDQSYHIGHHHAGIDIFSGAEPGVTPVYAAYPGYLTRLPDWRASLIIRIPSDPLEPGRQIWTYYTHLANEDGQSFISAEFPQGTSEKFVEAGTFLGYMGNFSGDPGTPTGLHLHFSVVKDDSNGYFLNELNIHNTYDPSPYFNLSLNHKKNPNDIPLCEQETTREEWDFVGADE
jgi:murein DD-endopeptidase MepM/ murein hydrolase activator NlpD